MTEPRRVHVVIANLLLAERVLRSLRLVGASGAFCGSVAEVAAAPAPVVLDLDHERLDAAAFLAELRARPELTEVPVLAFGAHVRAEALTAAREFNAFGLPRGAFAAQMDAWLGRLLGETAGGGPSKQDL